MAALPKYDVVSIDDLALEDIERIFQLSEQFAEALQKRTPLTLASGLIMATLFYEPSTRTRLSFESAMHRLGGNVISSPDMDASSAVKGETLGDTARIVSAYADVIVVRHPFDGAARVAADYAQCAVINAGDGSREHPTQTLCDLYTLRRNKGQLRGLNVAICGDLKFGRTVHSLIYALARFGANILAVPNQGMGIPDYVVDRVRAERGYSLSMVTLNELKSLAGGLDALYLTPSAPHQMALFTGEVPLEAAQVRGPGPAALDAFYVTRSQRERHGAGEAASSSMHFDARALKTSRTQEAVVMHPLPRTDELAFELDSDPRAIYFEQAAAGVPVRMALLAWMLENGASAARRREPAALKFKIDTSPRCSNVNCISRHESRYLRARFHLVPGIDSAVLTLRCQFCERELKIDYVGHASAKRYYRFDEGLLGYVRSWIDEGSLVVFESVKQAEEAGFEPYKRGPQREIMDGKEVAAAVDALVAQLVADLPDLAAVSIAGVVSHGAVLALRIRNLIEQKTRALIPCAAVDVHSGFDSLRAIDGSDNFQVDGRTIVLVDDVLNSGLTTQRGMATLWRQGRPASVKLAVLIDRGHRALPIRPNYVGKNIPTAKAERVQVRLGEPAEPGARGGDRVVLYSLVDSLKEGPPTR